MSMFLPPTNNRQADAFPLSIITAESCTRALFSGWVAHFGVPTGLTSHRGAQFLAMWASSCLCSKIQNTTTTAAHWQSNGLVEQFHRRLVAALKFQAA
jgi:hypothetical protein